MKKFQFYFAITGWTLGLIVHLLSLYDFDVTDKMPFVWVLHIGTFVVWIPIVFDLRKNEKLAAYQKSGVWNKNNPMEFSKILLINAPTWLKLIAIGSFIYAFINFIFFFSSQSGVPEFKNGQYILQDHGEIIKTLTKQEYHHYRANETRGFSGHWLAFYGFAAAILFPYYKPSTKE